MIDEFPLPSPIVEGKDYHYTDRDGNTLIDLCMGTSCTGMQGTDVHYRIGERIQSVPWNVYAYSNFWRDEAEEELQKHFPGYDFAFFSSGAECVEAAVRVASRISGDRILSFEGGFHGKTMIAGTLGVRSTNDGFLRSIIRPYGVEGSFPQYQSADTVIVEPFQTRNGVNFPTSEWQQELSDWAERNHVVRIYDEISTSIRSGRWRAWWPEDQPEMMLLGKGYGQGFPVSILCVREDLAAVAREVSLTSGYGGSPAASIAVAETIREVDRNNWLDEVLELGRDLYGSLKHLVQSGAVESVFGQGLWLGIAFRQPTEASRVVAELRQQGWLTGLAGDQIRLSPSFTMDRVEFHSFVETTLDIVGR